MCVTFIISVTELAISHFQELETKVRVHQKDKGVPQDQSGSGQLATRRNRILFSLKTKQNKKSTKISIVYIFEGKKIS